MLNIMTLFFVLNLIRKKLLNESNKYLEAIIQVLRDIIQDLFKEIEGIIVIYKKLE